MAAADDERSDPGTARRGPGTEDATSETSPRTEPSLVKNIERVADKVKGLLRSDG
ncbi:MAG TPA: hypothetical protein VLR27_11705 [Acidimicrobiales bacterium]|nr:hypothetical protein [Acidimicrobiales bacterium]